MLTREVFRLLTASERRQRYLQAVALGLVGVGWLTCAATLWLVPTPQPALVAPVLLALLCTSIAGMWLYANGSGGTHATIAENVRRFLAQTMNASAAGVVLVDARASDLPIVYTNDAFSRITGYTKEEVRGRNPRFLHGADTDAGALDKIRRALEAEQPCGVRVLNYRKDGAAFWNDLRISPVRDADGRPLYYLGLLLDVTEEVTAKETLARMNAELERRVEERTVELRQRERHLRGILDNTADMIVTIDERGKVTSFNAAAEQALGWREAEILGQDVSIIAEEPDRSRHPGYIDRYLNTGESRIMGVRARELVARRKNGETMPIELTIGEIRNNGSRNFVGVMRDITARRRQQEQLEASERRFRALAAATPFGLCVARLESGEIVYANEALARMYGSSSVAMIGRSTTELCDGLGEWSQFCETLRAEGHVAEMELRCHRADGTSVWLMLSAALAELDGAPAVIMGVYDISQRREAEARLQATAEALRRSEQELRLIADSLPMSVTFVDRDERYRFVNRTACQWYGKSAEEMIGRKVPEIVAPAAYERTKAYLERALRGEALRYEIEVDYPTGHVRRVEVQYIPNRHADGELAGFFAVITDVTERTRMEEQLRQSQRMETIGQLTGGIAHDFNNFLSVIIGNLDLALREVQEPRGRELIERAIGGGQRAAGLVQRMLSFSRRQSLQPSDIDVSRLIHDLALFAKRSLGDGVRLDLDLLPGTWSCHADRVQLESAIMNLAMNARDAMPWGGTIRIATANWPSGTLPPGYADLPAGDYVEITVADDGVGMEPEVLKRAFEPFFTTKEVGAGTGLGLSMVYGFARQSGGDVRIESDKGRGTRVSMLLPRAVTAVGEAEPVREPAEPPADQRAFGEGRIVLVVEDDATLRRFSVLALQELGFGTIEAASGDEGLAKLQAHPEIALLFTDVMLPGGCSGVDLARAAKSLRPGLPVLFTSGFVGKYAGGGDELLAEEALLPKPFRVSDLAARLAKLLRQTT